MSFIYVTTKDKQEALSIAKNLLQRKLVACANFFPIGSVYYSGEEVVEDKEYVLILKTDGEFKAVSGEIEKLHSYDVPCVAKIPVEFNDRYREWLARVK